MANVRLTMRKIREVLRLHFECDRNQREIADAVGASTTTVWQYLRRTRLAGLSWPLPTELQTDDAALEARLYPPPAPREPPRGMPDWAAVHREIGRKGVTLDLLWQEYKTQHPDGYGYSWVCRAYQDWAQRPAGHDAANPRAGARSCSLTTRARSSASSIRRPAKSARPNCS